MTIETLERLAIADPGQIIILRTLTPVTREQQEKLRVECARVTARTGVHFVVIDRNLEVATIKNEED